ncbi:hypothetical protein Pmani_031986 [Petrolisthes manimaculis]|uniref:DDE Tnp4 domain-containing protein n=1 Tax=Petrolisthes manimaculis TaxID=1843537 RepID=A0AAE1NTZ6_9EUCA|nr:hypothetical protein Pmani_031986 [Petrolisthes manimaculis]
MDDDILGALALLLLVKKRKLQKQEKKKRLWSRQWLQKRRDKGVLCRQVRELKEEDPHTLRQWILLDHQQYQELLNMVTPLIEKKDTNMRQAVTAAQRLTLTLRYLTTGESYRSLSCQFGISHNLISSIIPTVCKAIYTTLQPLYIKLPSTAEEWQKVADDFFSRWNFPKCLGALDGKRILMRKPPNSGSTFYDDKGLFSVNFIALVDADSKFMYVDVDTCERATESGVWDRCTLKEAVDSNVLSIPPPENIPSTNRKCPFIFVGDDAFPLKEYLMKPYPGQPESNETQIFNYRLSRARRTSENALGILAARFQVFRQPIRTTPENVRAITMAAVALHNFLIESSRDTYSPPDFIDREDTNMGKLERGEMHQNAHTGVEKLHADEVGPTNQAKEVREQLKGYFNVEANRRGVVVCRGEGRRRIIMADVDIDLYGDVEQDFTQDREMSWYEPNSCEV